MLSKYSLCGVDRHFLNTVVESFDDPTYTFQSLGLILASLLIAAALIAVAIYLQRKRSQQISLPENWIVKAENIGAIFQRALDERSKFEVSFATTGVRRRTTRCTLVDVGQQSLILEPPMSTKFSSEAVGRELRIFFGIASAKSPNERIYYTSVSELLAVERIGSDLVHLRVKLPPRLAVSQKRGHLRLSPPSKVTGEVLLWPYTQQWKERFEAMCLGGREAPHPAARFKLVNLSAGGMSLDAEYETRAKMLEDSPQLGADCLLYLELIRPESDSREEFYFVARTRHRQEMGRAVRLGLEFVQRVYPDPSTEGKLHWKQVESGGVNDLADWIMLRHLELFREHGFW